MLSAALLATLLASTDAQMDELRRQHLVALTNALCAPFKEHYRFRTISGYKVEIDLGNGNTITCEEGNPDEPHKRTDRPAKDGKEDR